VFGKKPKLKEKTGIFQKINTRRPYEKKLREKQISLKEEEKK